MPRTDWGWCVTPDELKSWIIHQSGELLVINKPPHLVCHPSKKGPWSSLAGACREYLGTDRVHPVSRLDRETSGVVVLALQHEMARLLQTAVQNREAVKTYMAVLEGTLREPVTVNAAIGRDPNSTFAARQAVVGDGQPSVTEFEPLEYAGDYTLVKVNLLTGRRHQIRVHAAYIGHAVVGDKLYGPDEKLMHEFVVTGWTEEMQTVLKLNRHALHASEIHFPNALPGHIFKAPLAEELASFWSQAAACPPAIP